MKVIAAALKNVYDRRETITRGLAITKEAPLMRHFTVELERLGEQISDNRLTNKPRLRSAVSVFYFRKNAIFLLNPK